MRITVLHNPNAGDDQHAGELIVAALERAGHDVRYHSTEKGKLRKMLRHDADLILIAGGDGTVRKVVIRLEPGAPPIAILPIGTANNVAKALRAWSGLQELVDGIDSAAHRRLDVWLARAGNAERRFIEALGGGAFARLMRSGSRAEDAAPHLPGNTIDRALRLLVAELERARPRRWGIRIDGRDYSGEYLLVEAMNMTMLGPNIPLAWDADPGDGLLNVIMLTAEQRAELLTYLAHRIGSEQTTLALPSVSGRAIELEVFGEFMHLDDERWPAPDSDDEEASSGDVRIERRGRRSPEALTGVVSVTLAPHGIEVLVVPTAAAVVR